MSFDRSKPLQSTLEEEYDDVTTSTLTRRGGVDDDDDNDINNRRRNRKNNNEDSDLERSNILHRKSNWIFHTISILKLNKTNALLIFFIPAVVMKALNVDETVTFFFNFLAIIPLSNILTIGVGDLAARFGPVGFDL
jgi:hypothetical protein